MDHIDRNYKIVKEKMIEQMEAALSFGRKLIDTELDVGIFNAIVKPIVKSFYDSWCDKDARLGTLQQIDVTLNASRDLLRNGNSPEAFDHMINKTFQEYLEGDQTYLQCKKDHKNFKQLKENTRKIFVSQVKDAMRFLEIEEKVENYQDLTKAAFKNKQEAYESLSRQLNYNDKGIKIVEKDPSILKIPAGRDVILKILRKGFEQTRKELIEGLDNTYN